MFDSLRKKLKEGVQKLTQKISQEAPEKRPEKAVKVPRPEKPLKPEKAKPVKPKIERPVERPAEKAKPEIERPVEKPLEKPAELQREEINEEKIEEPVPLPVPEAEAEKPAEEPEEKPEEEKEEKRGFFGRLRARVSERTLTEEDIDSFFNESETDLLQSNVALSVIEQMKSDLKAGLANKSITRTKAREFITQSFEESLLNIVDQGDVDLEGIIRKAKSEGRLHALFSLASTAVGRPLP